MFDLHPFSVGIWPVTPVRKFLRCFDLLFTTIHRGQMLGVYSGELASGMFERTTSMLEGGMQHCYLKEGQVVCFDGCLSFEMLVA